MDKRCHPYPQGFAGQPAQPGGRCLPLCLLLPPHLSAPSTHLSVHFGCADPIQKLTIDFLWSLDSLHPPKQDLVPWKIGCFFPSYPSAPLGGVGVGGHESFCLNPRKHPREARDLGLVWRDYYSKSSVLGWAQETVLPLSLGPCVPCTHPPPSPLLSYCAYHPASFPAFRRIHAPAYSSL